MRTAFIIVVGFGTGTEVANSDHGSSKATPTPSPIKSQGFRSGELKSGELKSGELKSGELKPGELRIGEPKESTAAMSTVPGTVVAEPAATSQPSESAVALQIDNSKAIANAQPNNIAAQVAGSTSSAQSDTSQQSRTSSSQVAAPKPAPQAATQQRQQGQQNRPTSTNRPAQQGNVQQQQQQPNQAAGRGAGRGQRQPQVPDAQEAPQPAARAPTAAWGGQKPLNFSQALASKPDKVCIQDHVPHKQPYETSLQLLSSIFCHAGHYMLHGITHYAVLQVALCDTL